MLKRVRRYMRGREILLSIRRPGRVNRLTESQPYRQNAGKNNISPSPKGEDRMK